MIDQTTPSIPKTRKSSDWDFLTIQEIESSPGLASNLPENTARRYHAIPIAADRSSVTIAMAEPEDLRALRAVREAVSLPTTIVKADVDLIDSLIIRNYQAGGEDPLRVMIWDAEEPPEREKGLYAEAFLHQFKAQLILVCRQESNRQTLAQICSTVQAQSVDLLIHCCPPSKMTRHLSQRKLVRECQTSILIVNKPRWPIRRVLLALQGGSADDLALNWAVRTALACQASLTVLPVVPPLPPVYAASQDCMAALLDSNTRLGGQLRLIARRLVIHGISGVIKLRYESAECQIPKEIADGNYDLVITGLVSRDILSELACPDLAYEALSLDSPPILFIKNAC